MQSAGHIKSSEAVRKFTVRSAAMDDAPAVAGVYQRARAKGLPFLPVLRSAQKIVPFFSAVMQGETALVAADPACDNVVGFISFSDVCVTYLYVEPTWQDVGVGSELLNRAKAGRQHLKLWTFQRNEHARRFYEHRGFVAIGFTDGSGNDKREPEVLYSWSAEDRSR